MQSKYRIILASETYPPDVNGAAIFVKRLATMLAENGHEVMVIVPGTTNKDKLEKVKPNLREFRVKTISIKPIHPHFRAVWKAGLTKKIEKAVLDFKPDIIHIHNHIMIGRTCLKVAKKHHIPIMGTNHFMPDNLIEYFPGFLSKTASHYMWMDFITVYNRLAYVTAPTHVALKMIKDLGLKAPSEVISNGIDLSHFKKIKTDKKIYTKFGLTPETPIFLFVGRLEKDKNIDIVLRALALNKKKMDVQMIVVGEGRDANAFRRLADKLKLSDRVIFTGKVSDAVLEQLYSVANVYIGSGSAELQGLAVMEAMANGLPVLAANAVALPELVKDGKNGYLFELDPPDLARKMVRIMKDGKKLKAMAAQSLKLIKYHSKEKTRESFEKLYGKLIKAGVY